MDAASNLPDELQEIETELRTASKRGDLEACRALVTRLAAEAELGRAVADEAELAQLELEEDVDVFPEIREAAEARIHNLLQTVIAGKIAVARHTYAVTRLHQIENGTG